MASFIGRVTFRCSGGKTITRRFIGPSSGEALKKMFKPGLERVGGPGCTVVSREIIKRGPGAGAMDRFEGGRKKRKRRKR